ncbi:MAG: HAMP domain-containing histidine kinase [Bacteroidia bacterium]|nr:HAMP domain-containing histidine kinase [Bacteroidia bacterium]
MVAHDLRSPLIRCRGIIEVLKISPDPLSKDQLRYINLASGVLERLDLMINRILDINALEQQEINLKLNRLDLSHLLTSIVRNFSDHATRKQIQLEHNLPKDRYFAQLDENYVVQIFETCSPMR